MYRIGIDKKMKFGKYQGLTPKQIITEKNDLGYIEFLSDQKFVLFNRSVWSFIEFRKLILSASSEDGLLIYSVKEIFSTGNFKVAKVEFLSQRKNLHTRSFFYGFKTEKQASDFIEKKIDKTFHIRRYQE